MYCAFCGKELPDNSKFCPACGKAVESIDVFQNASSESEIQSDNIAEPYPQEITEQPESEFSNETVKRHKFKLPAFFENPSTQNLFLYGSIIFPLVSLIIITLFFPLRFLYIIVYIITLLLASAGILSFVVTRTKEKQDGNIPPYNRKNRYKSKSSYKFLIPICIIFVIELAAAIFLEMPPLHQLQGKTFYSDPTENFWVRISFHRDYAEIFVGTYKYSPISPSGKALDESSEAEIPVKYIGKTSIEVGEEIFTGKLDDNILSFDYVADASFFDDAYSNAMRQTIKLGTPFEYESGTTWVKNNWDVYFNTAERAERIVNPQHFEDEEEPSSSSSLIE